MTSSSISNRKDARNSLATALGTITGFQAVYDHLPKGFDGQSPVCTIDAVSQYPDLASAPGTETFQFAVGVWVRRDDAAAAEDTLDDLAQDVAEAVEAWHNGIFYQASEATYEELESGQYRVEWHFVQVDWE